jgi:hypothetical protein
MPPSRIPIIIGIIIIAVLVVGGIIWSQQHPDPALGQEETNTTPKPPVVTNASTQPYPKNKPPKNNSNDPLLNAIRVHGGLKIALESLQADATLDPEGQLYRLGLDSLPITDAALSVIAKQTQLRALYLFDTKISDAGLTQLKTLKELKILMLTGSPVSSAGVDALRMALPNCIILF